MFHRMSKCWNRLLNGVKDFSYHHLGKAINRNMALSCLILTLVSFSYQLAWISPKLSSEEASFPKAHLNIEHSLENISHLPGFTFFSILVSCLLLRNVEKRLYLSVYLSNMHILNEKLFLGTNILELKGATKFYFIFSLFLPLLLLF